MRAHETTRGHGARLPRRIGRCPHRGRSSDRYGSRRSRAADRRCRRGSSSAIPTNTPPRARHRIRARRGSRRSGRSLPPSTRWARKSFDAPRSIDAVSMPTPRTRRSVTSHRAASLRQAGEMEMRDVAAARRCRDSSRGRASSAHQPVRRSTMAPSGIRPWAASCARRPSTRMQQVTIRGGARADVDPRPRGPAQPVERDLVRGPAALGEMDRRVEVRAAVLGGAEVVGGVPPAARASCRARRARAGSGAPWASRWSCRRRDASGRRAVRSRRRAPAGSARPAARPAAPSRVASACALRL